MIRTPTVSHGGNAGRTTCSPVNLEELLYGCVAADSEWHRVERLGSAHLFYQVATSDPPLALFEWPVPGEPIFGSLYLTTFGLRKTFVVMRSRGGPTLAVAAFRGLGPGPVTPLCVSSLLSHGDEWFGHELFDELPARTVNRRPDLLPKQTLLDGYCDWAAHFLGAAPSAQRSLQHLTLGDVKG